MTNISRIRAAYFSPCGSTKAMCTYLATLLSDLFSVPWDFVDFTLPGQRLNTYSFSREELVVFGLPTYAGRIPNKILPFIQENIKGDETCAACIVTFGNRSRDSSLAELVKELSGNGFLCIAAASIVSRHVFSEKIAKERPGEEDLKLLGELALDIQKNIKLNEKLILTQNPSICGENAVLPYYIPKGLDGEPVKFLKAKPKTIIDKCEKCGICVRNCPMGAIDGEDSSLVTGTCIKCQACIKKCPVKAKYFDDEAFLSHVKMLEKNFTRPALSEKFS